MVKASWNLAWAVHWYGQLQHGREALAFSLLLEKKEIEFLLTRSLHSKIHRGRQPIANPLRVRLMQTMQDNVAKNGLLGVCRVPAISRNR